MYVPLKLPKPKVPEYLKSTVKSGADEFVESFLKLNFPNTELNVWGGGGKSDGKLSFERQFS